MSPIENKARKVIFCLFLLSIQLHAQNTEGCAAPGFIISDRIKFGYTGGTGKTDTILTIDTMKIWIGSHSSPQHCVGYSNLVIENEDKIIFQGPWMTNLRFFEFIGYPGHYKITCDWQLLNYPAFKTLLEFDLILIPLQLDTASIASIPPLKVSNADFLIYPNPCSSNLYLINESSPIQVVGLYNLTGELLLNQNLNSTEFLLPMEHLPNGMYFLQVTTLSDKKILRRIVKH